jgi:hypothetical protein
MNKNNGMFLIRIIGVFLLITTGAFTDQGQTFAPCFVTVNEIKINLLYKKIEKILGTPVFSQHSPFFMTKKTNRSPGMP